MTKEDIQRKIKEISCEKCGIEVFACIKEKGHYCLKKIKGTDKLRSSVLSRLGPTIASVFLAGDAEFESSDNIADNKRVLYEIVQSEIYRPFAFLKAFKSVSAEYTENDKENFLGFLFRINHNDNFFGHTSTFTQCLELTAVKMCLRYFQRIPMMSSRTM